jgi:hypothetical protein
MGVIYFNILSRCKSVVPCSIVKDPLRKQEAFIYTAYMKLCSVILNLNLLSSRCLSTQKEYYVERYHRVSVHIYNVLMANSVLTEIHSCGGTVINID